MSRFVFVKGAAAFWPVKWNEPVDGGGVAEQSMLLRFRRISAAELAALTDPQNPQSDFAFFAETVTGWADIVDEDGAPVPFEAEAIAAMIERPAFAAAMGLAFFDFYRAIPETRLGNSNPSPAGGPAAGEPIAPAPAAGGAKPPAKASGSRSKKPG